MRDEGIVKNKMKINTETQRHGEEKDEGGRMKKKKRVLQFHPSSHILHTF
jgi:hypothetical protein